uniref:Uncharacterized protein n=1 Tax=Gracilaria gracilis TaxID=2777 RepID=A0A345U7S2_GRAGA|nr:hypothetical protein [Gracilaria gracilis]AXI96508.1 hypothetical protein [Gracilaria gracilis]
MNLIENSLLNRYIYSPKTWVHKLKPHYKTYPLFIYLCFISYIHSKYISISLCIYCMFFLHFKKINNNYAKILFYILYILLILGYIIFFSTKFQFNICIITLSHIHHILIYIYNKYILYFRTVLILMHYFFTVNIIFMTTTYEDIIFSFLKLFQQNENNTVNKIIFISIFAAQVLESIVIKIKHILLSIRIKKITIFFKSKYSIYLIFKFIQDLHNDIYRISTVLYARELNKNLLYITDIYE